MPPRQNPRRRPGGAAPARGRRCRHRRCRTTPRPADWAPGKRRGHAAMTPAASAAPIKIMPAEAPGSSRPMSTSANSNAARPGSRILDVGAIGNQPGPFPQDAGAGGGAKQKKRPAAHIGTDQHERSKHGRRNDAKRQVIRAAEPRRDFFGGAAAALVEIAHDPVWAINPPNRRSRRRYSAMTPSSAARSKSGQLIGTNTNSL